MTPASASLSTSRVLDTSLVVSPIDTRTAIQPLTSAEIANASSLIPASSTLLANSSISDAKSSTSRVRIVSPARTPIGEDRPLKSILRIPTKQFPTHHDTIREGVAPLKVEAARKGIPVDAKWTKIDRRIVNPEALKEAGERFEERMDYVIVLRVLTQKEIQELAERTGKIRRRRDGGGKEKDRDRERDRGERDRRDGDREVKRERERDRESRSDWVSERDGYRDKRDRKDSD
jgi:zinc finger CCCH domain-containing protein 13